uniref:Uncharacterized protein n=1 Tax=Timema tahoe TaxID=61484 RepID=A0A7R9ILH4_9NEOP|nr:unnamed protein product [Timema tahoe]
MPIYSENREGGRNRAGTLPVTHRTAQAKEAATSVPARTSFRNTAPLSLWNWVLERGQCSQSPDFESNRAEGTISTGHTSVRLISVKHLRCEVQYIAKECEEVSTGEVKEPPGEDKQQNELVTLAAKLLEEWATLKEVFRIPKKERIEQMKEHEREADFFCHVAEKQTPDTSWTSVFGGAGVEVLSSMISYNKMLYYGSRAHPIYTLNLARKRTQMIGSKEGVRLSAPCSVKPNLTTPSGIAASKQVQLSPALSACEGTFLYVPCEVEILYTVNSQFYDPGNNVPLESKKKRKSMCFPPLPAAKTQKTASGRQFSANPLHGTAAWLINSTFVCPPDFHSVRLAPDCTYEEYIAADDDITVWGTLDNADIIREQQESSDEEGEE